MLLQPDSMDCVDLGRLRETLNPAGPRGCRNMPVGDASRVRFGEMRAGGGGLASPSLRLSSKKAGRNSEGGVSPSPAQPARKRSDAPWPASRAHPRARVCALNRGSGSAAPARATSELHLVRVPQLPPRPCGAHARAAACRTGPGASWVGWSRAPPPRCRCCYCCCSRRSGRGAPSSPSSCRTTPSSASTRRWSRA